MHFMRIGVSFYLQPNKCHSKEAFRAVSPSIEAKHPNNCHRDAIKPPLAMHYSFSPSTMALITVATLVIALVHLFGSCFSHSFAAEADVFLVVMEDEPVISYKAGRKDIIMSGDDAQKYKEKVITMHDIFLESLLPTGSYTKLYSYTHLFNGFAVHTASEEALGILQDAQGVRIIHKDMKMKKMTTHSPEYLSIPSGVWPELGGPERSGEGVVIGVIDTGVNPNHPSFANRRLRPAANSTKFKGMCEPGDEFPSSACNGKIVGARYFAHAAIAAGDFNASRDYASPFDADGHGSHTASTAAGNYRTAVLSNGYNYGYASGMAPGAQISVYKAVYSFGGYMSDVVAAVDKAVEDGVDILSLSIGPSLVPPGPAVFLNILEMELLFATKSGVLVVQAAGNGGPSASSVLSFSPWITSVAASSTDRKYNNSMMLGSRRLLTGTGLSPPTSEEVMFPIAAAQDVCTRNTSYILVQNCQRPDPFNLALVRGKLIICTYVDDFIYTPTSIDAIVSTIQTIGAVGFIITMAEGLGSESLREATATLTLTEPGIVISDRQDSEALWEYYESRTVRGRDGSVLRFGAVGRILDGRHAVYTGQAPIVASYSSRGPDVNNALMQTADILKPSIMAPGSSIWAAWSPQSESDQYNKGQEFAVLSGTSMATPHVAGVAALIKQKHPDWSPAAITSAMMTTANVTDRSGGAMLAQQSGGLTRATPFDYGAGAINPTRAIDPGLILDIEFKNYIQFLCAVPGVDEESVRRAVGIGCPTARKEWCSDLNTASVTVSNLVGSRRVVRRVTSVANVQETYQVIVREPAGVTVTVTPQAFTIRPNSSRSLMITLEAKEATNTYTFGELVLDGDRKHVVRIPLAISVTSTLRT